MSEVSLDPSEIKLDDENKYTVLEDISDNIVLPIGIEKNGVRYRNIVIDELSGIDESLAANKKKTGGNPAKALTKVLARCIQEIEDLVPRKKNPDKLIDESITRNMYQCDRDFVLSRIQILSEQDDAVLRGKCPKCQTVVEQDVKISNRKIISWPKDKPAQIDFELKRGYFKDGVHHRKGTMRFTKGADQEHVAMLAMDDYAKALTAMFAATIIKLGDMDGIDQDIASKLKSRDRRLLFNLVREQTPGILMWEFLQCYNCYYDEVEAVLSMSSFF